MASQVIRKAADWTSANNVLVGGQIGEGVIYTRPQYQGGEPPYISEAIYDIVFNESGNYEIWVEYASNEPRVARLTFDNQAIKGTCSTVTGGWESFYQVEEKQGVVAITAGVHRLGLWGRPLPHIRTFKFKVAT